ncbi:MAG: helix-turn-helix transcriptional regulator [Dehalococcoidia bacterium]|nr:helix-turn-helix transcriptional regulator [Dehalococcoidia bacterium]
MPRYRNAESRPIDHLAEGEQWPYGKLEEDAPLEARHAQAVGQRLHEAMQGRTNKEVAALADITENTLGRLIRGQAWGALPILIRLEAALDTDLWGGKTHQNKR